MRKIAKAANRFDSIWTTVLMLPAFVMLMNAAVSVHQGTATPGELAGAAQYAAQKFTGQYTPYIETTASGILAGIQQLSKSAGSCVSGAGAPIFLKPGMAHRNGCALGNAFASAAPIKPYRGY